MADEKTAAGFAEASRNLQKVTGELREFNLNAGKEIADQMGKEITKVTDPFVSAFQTIPGVQTLGTVGKTIFNKTFAALKDKREKELLRQRLGIGKEEFELLQKQKSVIDAQNEYQKKFDEATENLLGLNEVEIRGLRSDLGQFLNFEDAVDRLIDINQDAIDADADRHAYLEKGASRRVEKENEEARAQQKQQTALEAIGAGIMDMKEGILNGLAGLKDKGLLGLGILAGLVAAPFVAIKAFFLQLGAEVKVLRDIVKGIKNGKFFTSVGKILNGLFSTISKGFKTLLPGAGTGTNPLANATKSFTDSIKKVGNIFKPIVSTVDNVTDAVKKSPAVKTFGSVTQNITKFIDSIKKGLKPFIDGLKTVATGASNFIKSLPGFSSVVKFAATIGRTLGKIFLPITVIMGVFDFVKGFMEGFKEDGIIGGIREGFIGLVDGLVGGLIRMITGALAFILDFLGLDQFAAAIKQNVDEAIEGIYEAFRGIFDIVKGIFTLDFGLVGDGIASIFTGVIEVMTAPFDMIYGLIKDVFSFFGFELPDFDLADTILGFVGAAYDFVKNKVKGFFSFLGFGGEEEELEKKSAAADKRLEFEDRRSDIIARGDPNFETDVGKKALERYGVALDESIAAEEALEAFRNKPKLKDVINTATEKTKEVFGSISESVSAGFSSAVAFVTDLFSFSSEDATVAGVATKLLDIILAPYNLAINFLRGIFGFGEDEEGNQLPSFSIGELLIETMTNIFNWFSNLLDIDVGALVKKIPGAGKVIDFLFGDETAEDRIADQQALVDKLQRDVDTDRFYESDAQKERDKVALAEAMAELESMRSEAGVTVVNNNNVVNANTSNNASTTTIAPMRDTSPPAGSVPAYG